MIAAAGSCRGGADELGNRAMVRAGPLSPDGEERPAEPLSRGVGASPGLGEGWDRPAERTSCAFHGATRAPITGQSSSRRTLSTSALPAVSAQSAGSGRSRPMRG